MNYSLEAVSKFVEDKFYFVEYDDIGGRLTDTVKGFMINYSGRKIVMVTNKGLFQIDCNRIKFMKPCKAFDIADGLIEIDNEEETE